MSFKNCLTNTYIDFFMILFSIKTPFPLIVRKHAKCHFIKDQFNNIVYQCRKKKVWGMLLSSHANERDRAGNTFLMIEMQSKCFYELLFSYYFKQYMYSLLNYIIGIDRKKN